MRIAVEARVPTIVLMREPSDAIASYMLHIKSPITQSSKKGLREDELCEVLLRDWQNYYCWVRRLGPRIKVIISERAFSEPAAVGKFVAGEIGSDLHDSEIERRWDDFHYAFKEKDKTKKQGSTSFPNEVRERQKVEIQAVITGSPRLLECVRLYEEICLAATVPP